MLLVRSKYLIDFFQSIFFLFIIFSFPCYLLDTISNISNNYLANRICNIFACILFKLPITPITYIIISNKLINQLTIISKKHNNPNHIYQSILLIITYLFFFVTSSINIYFATIINAISYSIYISEILYNFIDNKIYEFNNYVDFYNYNKYTFIPIGFLFSFCMNYIGNYYIPIFYFSFTSLISPILLNYQFNSYNNLKYQRNIFYYFELPLNLVIYLLHTYLYNNLTIKNLT
jgi:hypothetical protein